MRKFIHTLLITFCAAFGLAASAQKIESITAPSEISIPVGYSYQIKASVTPANAANKALEWISLDEDIVTVSSTGVVIGKKKGEAGVFVRSVDNEWANAMITVYVTPAGTEPVLPDPGTDPDPGTGTGGGGNGGDNGGNTGGDTGSTDGKVYSIRLAGTAPALYLTTTPIADNNGQTYSLSTAAEGFTLTGDSKGGYLIQSVEGQKAYVGVSKTVDWDCADVQTYWSIDNIDSTEPVAIVRGNSGKGLGCDNIAEGKMGVFTDKGKGNSQYYTWYIEELKGTEPIVPDPGTDPDPEQPETKTCAKPVITLADGLISLTCETEGAVISYSVTTPDLSLSGTGTPDFSGLANSVFTLTAKATAEGYNDSEVARQYFTFEELTSLIGSRGDMNEDGSYTIIDVARLIDHMIKK